MDTLNEEGPLLAGLSPGHGSLKVDDVISKDNKKFSAVKEQIEKRAEKIKLQRTKSCEVSMRFSVVCVLVHVLVGIKMLKCVK